MHSRLFAPIPRADEFMSDPAFTLRPDDGVMAAVDALLRRGLAGAPVVDAQGRLVGVLSEHDCMRLMARAALRTPPEGQVCEHMSPNTVTVAADDDLFSVLSLLQEDDRGGLPVVAGGRLLGLVARHDVLRALDRIRHAREATVVGPTDRFEQDSATPRA